MTHYYVFETSHGFVGLAGSDGMLQRSTLPKASREEALIAINAGLEQPGVEDIAAFDDLPDRLTRYFDGERVEFSDVPVDVSGFSPFYAAALLAAQRIPYGSLVTYAELARMAGSERAARAAGGAMASNQAPIIVPCHRVVAAGGGLGGFSAGLEWKIELLEIEKVRNLSLA